MTKHPKDERWTETSSWEPETGERDASATTCPDGGQVVFICGQKLLQTVDCLSYIEAVFLRGLVAGERLSLHASAGGKQWSPGTAPVAAMLSLSLSLTDTFGTVLSFPIPLWQSFHFLPKFLLNTIRILFQTGRVSTRRNLPC